MVKSQLFQDIFEITDVDPSGKKFDRVSRVVARSENTSTELVLDINTEIYPLNITDKLTLTLASTLSMDGAPVDMSKREPWRESLRGASAGGRSLADDFDYVMYGKVYKYEDTGDTKVSVYASYGGLLMCLSGDYRQLQAFSVGQYIYLLIRK